MSTTIGLIGEMTFDCRQMELEATSTSTQIIEKIKAECQVVDPNTFDWSSVETRRTWFICFNEHTKKCYYFPISESENRDDNYARVKSGMAHFISRGWLAYKIQ